MSDAQTGHEKTLTALLPALAGANLIYGVGQLETGVTMDYGQLVMDNEFIGMVKYVLKGIPVNDETLAVDVIREVGAFKDFLSQDHTLEHMKTEQTHPELIDRRVREEWEASGGKSIHERAWEKARHILETHHPEAIPSDVRATMRSIVEETEEELGVSKKKKAAAS
jgi:trimethylamine--corrinoid protein Co-methyltransferase